MHTELRQNGGPPGKCRILSAVGSPGGGPVDDIVIGLEELAEDPDDAGFGLAGRLHLYRRPSFVGRLPAQPPLRCGVYLRSAKMISR
jgi:hypothetical protein